VDSKHVDESKCKRTPNGSIEICVVDLPLSDLLVFADVLEERFDIRVSEWKIFRRRVCPTGLRTRVSDTVPGEL
jgi:hypothetical protein